MAPVTLGGKVFGGLVMILGIGEFGHLVLDNPELHDILTQIMKERLSEIEGSGGQHH